MLKVIYIARTMPHYRERILEELGELCDLTVVTGGASLGLGREVASGHIVESKLKVWPSPFGKGKVYWQSVSAVIKQVRPDLVISEFGLSLLHTYFLHFLRFIYGYKLTYWTHGLGAALPSKPLEIHEAMRLKMLALADGNFFYTGRCKEVFEKLTSDRYGCSWVVWNTLDTDTINKVWNTDSTLDFPNDRPYVVYIGRLVKAKRCEELIQLAQALKERNIDMDVVIIGNGDMENMLIQESEQSNLPIIFKGAIIDERIKARWLKHAIIHFCPGRIGLNIVDAFGYGCGIISYSRQVGESKHAPEVEYLEHNENGWLMDDFSEVLAKIIHLSKCSDDLVRLRINARKTFMKRCQISRQISGFSAGLKEFSKNKKTKTGE